MLCKGLWAAGCEEFQQRVSLVGLAAAGRVKLAAMLGAERVVECAALLAFAGEQRGLGLSRWSVPGAAVLGAAAQPVGAGLCLGRGWQLGRPLSLMSQSHQGDLLCQATCWAPCSASSAVSLIPLAWLCTHGGFAGSLLPAPPANGMRLRWVWGSMETPCAHTPTVQIGAISPIPAANCRQR